MSKYITDLEVSTNVAEAEILIKRGFEKIPHDLAQDTADYPIYLWCKKGDRDAITRIQLTYMAEMESGLITMKYTKLDHDINGGNRYSVNLWYFRGTTEADVPIVDLQVTTNPSDEAKKFSDGWERLACDLAATDQDTKLYLWMKREKTTFIREITATDDYSRDLSLFQAGYIRMDLLVNKGKEGAPVFIWYLPTTDSSKVVKNIKVSTNRREEDEYQKQDYIQVDLDLNKWCWWNREYLWYTKTGPKYLVKVMTMIPPSSASLYVSEAAMLIKKRLGTSEYFLCFHR